MCSAGPVRNQNQARILTPVGQRVLVSDLVWDQFFVGFRCLLLTQMDSVGLWVRPVRRSGPARPGLWGQWVLVEEEMDSSSSGRVRIRILFEDVEWTNRPS